MSKPWQKSQDGQRQASAKARRRREQIAERKLTEPERVVGRKHKREEREARRAAKIQAKRDAEDRRLDGVIAGMVREMRQGGNVS